METECDHVQVAVLVNRSVYKKKLRNISSKIPFNTRFSFVKKKIHLPGVQYVAVIEIGN